MKQIIFLLVLIPFFTNAQFRIGNITFNDGSAKNGLIEIPSGKTSKIKFKADKSGKVEKIDAEEVKSMQIQNENNVMEDYTTIILGNNKILNITQFNLDSKKSFVKILKKGKITLYSLDFIANSGGGMKNFYVESVAFYLQRENDNFAFSIGMKRADLNFMTGMIMTEVVKVNFKDICPGFYDKVVAAKLTSKELYKLVDIYEENCN